MGLYIFVAETSTGLCRTIEVWADNRAHAWREFVAEYDYLMSASSVRIVKNP